MTTSTQTNTRLTGDALLNLCDAMTDATVTEKATAAGYTEQKSNGTIRVCYTAFYDELLIAKGVEQPAPKQTESYELSGESKQYTISYPVTAYVTVTVERDSAISEEDLLSSITKQDLVDGEYNDDDTWDELKEVWRSAGPGELTITDEGFDRLFTD